MSLRAFHIFFIAVSVLMSLRVGGWGVREFLQQGSRGGLALGVSCFVLGFVLVIYGLRIYRKLQALER